VARETGRRSDLPGIKEIASARNLLRNDTNYQISDKTSNVMSENKKT
jgi:hypothetical protein